MPYTRALCSSLSIHTQSNAARYFASNGSELANLGATALNLYRGETDGWSRLIESDFNGYLLGTLPNVEVISHPHHTSQQPQFFLHISTPRPVPTAFNPVPDPCR